MGVPRDHLVGNAHRPAVRLSDGARVRPAVARGRFARRALAARGLRRRPDRLQRSRERERGERTAALRAGSDVRTERCCCNGPSNSSPRSGHLAHLIGRFTTTMAYPTHEFLQTHQEDKTFYMTLNRPDKMNAMRDDMLVVFCQI